MIKLLVQHVQMPLSIDEVKTYLRIGSDGDDDMLMLFLRAAVELVEKRNSIALISRKLRQSISSDEIANGIKLGANKFGKGLFSKTLIRPAFTPIISIDAIRTLGANGMMINAPDGLVSLDENLFRINGFSDGLEIDYSAGFTNVDAIPNTYKLEILEEINRAILNRDNEGAKPNLNNGVRL